LESTDTDEVAIAQMRVTDVLKEHRTRAVSQEEIRHGKMTMARSDFCSPNLFVGGPR
jgi:hypothetical protein